MILCNNCGLYYDELIPHVCCFTTSTGDTAFKGYANTYTDPSYEILKELKEIKTMLKNVLADLSLIQSK
jgi:hypothetical protein